MKPFFLHGRNHSICKTLNPAVFFFHLTLFYMPLIIYGCGLPMCAFLVSLFGVQLPLTHNVHGSKSLASKTELESFDA